MLRRSFVPACIAAVAFAPRVASAQRSSDSSPNVMKIAQGIERQWVSNYDAASAGAIAAMFATDGNFITASGVVLSGQSAIADALAARMKAGWTKETVDVTEAHANGSTMWIVGQYMLVGSGPYDGKQILGSYMKVLSQTGGEWRIRTLMSNALPLGIASPATPR